MDYKSPPRPRIDAADRDLDRELWRLHQVPEHARRPPPEHATPVEVHHRRRGGGKRLHPRSPDEVHISEQRVETPALEPMPDRASGDPSREQLAPVHDSALPLGDPCELSVAVPSDPLQLPMPRRKPTFGSLSLLYDLKLPRVVSGVSIGSWRVLGVAHAAQYPLRKPSGRRSDENRHGFVTIAAQTRHIRNACVTDSRGIQPRRLAAASSPGPGARHTTPGHEPAAPRTGAGSVFRPRRRARGPRRAGSAVRSRPPGRRAPRGGPRSHPASARR